MSSKAKSINRMRRMTAREITNKALEMIEPPSPAAGPWMGKEELKELAGALNSAEIYADDKEYDLIMKFINDILNPPQEEK
jgi:hypothetical protein